MKNKIIDNYTVIIILLSYITNIIISNIEFYGFLYKFSMFLLTVINGYILIKYKNRMKYKDIIIMCYIYLNFYAKDSLQLLFIISNIGILCIMCFKESKLVKIISILFIIYLFFIYTPLLKLYNTINYNTYYCNNNYKIELYSIGAMSSTKYKLHKRYAIINIDDIIEIYYVDTQKISKKEYLEIIDNNICEVEGD